MADYFEQLKTIQEEIKALNKEILVELERVENNPGDNAAKARLAFQQTTLTKLEEDEKFWENLILETAQEKMESKLFGEADDDWIESVTGVDTKRRRWNTYTIDDNIVPSPSFKDRFDQISRVFHLEKEAGRRIFLNLFLADIVDREEFQGKLRIFTELEMSITKVVGGKRRKLGGKHDYTIGFGQGLDPFGQKTPPKELHLVAIEGSRNWEEQNLWQCVAEAATIFRVRKDAKKAKCSVWGVLTNATDWIFIHIDEDGKLHRSTKFLLNLPDYHENEVFFIYRLLYHVVDQCFRACTPPGSEESLNAANHAENDDSQ